MFRWIQPGRWIGLLLVLATPAWAQGNGHSKAELMENHPNPFFPSTTIPFEIHQDVCARGHQPVVTINIYNVLVQVVAAPTIEMTDRQVPVQALQLGCGSHSAVWDGRLTEGNRDAPDGVYYYQLIVDGERISTRKMIVKRIRR